MEVKKFRVAVERILLCCVYAKAVTIFVHFGRVKWSQVATSKILVEPGGDLKHSKAMLRPRAFYWSLEATSLFAEIVLVTSLRTSSRVTIFHFLIILGQAAAVEIL